MEALYFFKMALNFMVNHMIGKPIEHFFAKLRNARYVVQGCQRVEMKNGSLGTRILIDRLQLFKLPDDDRSRRMQSTKRYLQIFRRFCNFELLCRLMHKRLNPHMCHVHDIERLSQNSNCIICNTKHSLISLPILLLNTLSFLLYQLDILIVLPLCNHGREDDRKDRTDCLHDSRPGLNGCSHFRGHVVIPLRVLETGF